MTILHTPGKSDVTSNVNDLEEALDDLGAALDSVETTVEDINCNLHNVERWWGALQEPNETNAIDHGLTPFRALSGDNDWGPAIPICGTADLPTLIESETYNPHRLLVVNMGGEVDMWRIRLIYGTGTPRGAIATDQWSEVMIIADDMDTGLPRGQPIEIGMVKLPIGTKLWAQVWNDTNEAPFQFFWGCHGYPCPTFP